AHWDGKHLSFTDGARKSDVPDADALDAHWRAYYSAIFNPARVKLKAMQAEMPKKYWKNLPEAGLIANLTRDAGRRAAGMLEAEPTAPARKGRVALPDRHARSLPGLDEAASLPELAAACRVCRACALCGPATQAVFGEGPADARLMIVGEQPGDREDLEGRPFVGPAGALLDELLDEAGVAREAVYLTNAVKHFGFERRGKRRLHKTAKTAEADECLPWLEKEIAFVKPRAILAMGRTSARVLFGPGLKVTEVRGRAMPTRQGPSGLVTFHPAYILRQRDRGAAARARAALSDDLRAALELANGAVATAA
ncbi:MAG: UdgX family uracil-DNA binding protein, partial [Alphaproteobacteria bacterium]|nr:UdgX family uracil-DNA binding protein [Alphaproteobacteria bacterium]